MRILLLDGNNLVMRGIHAMSRSGLEVDGISTGPLLVCINALSRHIREERPDHIVVCWDSGPSLFRLALYPDYKAHRNQVDDEFARRKDGTFALVKEFCSLAGVHQVHRPGYEADDLIAWYVDQYRGEEVIILSSDKDFLQLLGPGVEQIRFSSGGAETDRWTEARVIEEYKCRPSQLPDVMALSGDTSDNVPGVPGFGTKTAVKHLSRTENWALEEVDHPKVKEHWEQVLTARALVDLTTPRRELNLPRLPKFEPTAPGKILFESLVAFLVTYRIESVKARLYSGQLWADTPSSTDPLDRSPDQP